MRARLKAYQVESVAFLLAHHRAILGDQMGLGKTRTVLEACLVSNYKQILVVAPKFALGVWVTEIALWTDYTHRVFTGKPHQRAQILGAHAFEPANVTITNVELLSELPTTGWDCVIVDEIHMKFRNRKNRAFKVLKQFTKPEGRGCWLLSGSPVVSGAIDLWAYFNILQPTKWPSFWRYARDFTNVIQGPFGMKIEGVQNPTVLREHLAVIMTRHLKSDVAEQLPEKTRQPIWLEMTPKQAQLYNAIVDDMFVEINDDILIVKNKLAEITRLRQCLVTPYLLGLSEPGVALLALKELRESTNEPIVIFTPFRKAIDYIEDTIGPLLRIVGGKTSAETNEVIKTFQAAEASSGITLVCTIQSAQSFTLSNASLGVVLGPDWTPALMEQAEDRLHRIGQKNPVHISYLLHKNTVEKRVMQALDTKTKITNVILRRSDFH